MSEVRFYQYFTAAAFLRPRLCRWRCRWDGCQIAGWSSDPALGYSRHEQEYHR